MAIALNDSISARLPAGFQEFLDRLIAEFDPERVILFGSRARGDATEDSDTDLLVVMPCDDLPLRVARRIRMSLRPLFPIDLVAMDADEIARRQVGRGLDFVDIVMREGVPLYERDAR